MHFFYRDTKISLLKLVNYKFNLRPIDNNISLTKDGSEIKKIF